MIDYDQVALAFAIVTGLVVFLLVTICVLLFMLLKVATRIHKKEIVLDADIQAVIDQMAAEEALEAKAMVLFTSFIQNIEGAMNNTSINPGDRSVIQAAINQSKSRASDFATALAAAAAELAKVNPSPADTTTQSDPSQDQATQTTQSSDPAASTADQSSTTDQAAASTGTDN